MRPFAVLLAAVFLLATVWATSIFIRWCELDDSILFPAVEIGRQAAFPPGHFEFGWVVGAASATFAALTIGAVWCAVVVIARPIGSVVQAFVMTAGVALVGSSVPCIVRYTLLGFVPLIAGAGLMLLALLWPARVARL